MFEVNGYPILRDSIDVLVEIRKQSGRDIMRDISFAGDKNIMFTCPFHKNGAEKKPSFGVNVDNMLCHCFTCGWAGTLEDMVSSIFGYDDLGYFGRKWLATNFLSFTVETRKPISFNVCRDKTVNQKQPGFTEEELDSYRYIHPYMYKRGLTDELIETFDIGYDRITDCITIPVYHKDGVPAFIARRSVSTKFFNYPKGAEKPVYCAERLVSGDYSSIIVCESVFNALTCWRYGRPAVALLGTGSSFQVEVLRSLPVRKYILGMDGDAAGKKAAQTLKDRLADKIVTFLEVPDGKDINDLGESFLQLNEYF